MQKFGISNHQCGTSLRVRYEEIAIWLSVDNSGHYEGPRGRRMHLPFVFGSLHRSCWVRHGDFWSDARFLLRVVREGGLTCIRLLRMERSRKKRGKRESG
jgi:hypothetical protein